jgi:hypothetical protein
MRRKIILYLIPAFAAVQAWAQNDTLRTDVIDVIKPFKAILSESIKIPANPNPEIPDIKPVTLTYTLPEVRHNDVPTVYTIKPLSLGTSLLPKLKNNYTRLGYGNYNTPLFEMYLNSTRSRSAQWGAFYKHLSSSADNLRSFSNNTLGLYGKKFVDNGIVESDILYHRNVVHLYGYSDEATLPKKDDLRNQFGLLEMHGAYSNVLKDTSKLAYKIGMRYYSYSTNNKVDEGDFKLYGNFSKSMSGNPLKVFTQVQINNTTAPGLSYNRVFVDINPEYRLNISKAIYVSVGFNSTFFNDSSASKFFFFPKAEAGLGIIRNALTFYTGITGNLQRNTLRSITTENPFVRSFGLDNTENRFEAYAGFKGIISAQTSFLLQASYATIRNMMFYGADTISYAQNTIFDPNTSGLTHIKAELNHDFWKSFRMGVAVNYFGYDLTIAAPYSRPTFTTTAHFTYNMADKFLLKTEVFTMNQRTALLRGTAGNNSEVKMDGLVDLNAGLEYRYSKTVGLFLNVNNLTNNQYQRWLNMPVFGINVLGGLTVTF